MSTSVDLALCLPLLPASRRSCMHWGMCLTELVRNTIGGCNATDQPSYIIYGAATPAGAALKTTPMMTSAQVNASAAALNMSTITQDRLQTRLLVVTTGLSLTLQNGTVVTGSYTGITGLTNMDTGAYGALQIPNDNVYAAYKHSVGVRTYEALKNGSIQNCSDVSYRLPGDICSDNTNRDGFECFFTQAADSTAAGQQAAADRLLSLYPKNLRWTFQGGATTDVQVAYAVPSCRNSTVYVCSHLSAAGSNGGIQYPFWVAQSWMYGRFIQYDMRRSAVAPAGSFRFSEPGATDCSQFASAGR